MDIFELNIIKSKWGNRRLNKWQKITKHNNSLYHDEDKTTPSGFSQFEP